LTAIVRLAVIFCRSGLIRLDADAHSYVAILRPQQGALRA